MLNRNIKIKICVLIIDKNDKVLLIREKIKKKDGPLWNVVKGTYDNKKESIFEAAVRECQEETSTKVELTNVLGIYTFKKEPQIRIQFNFLAKIKNGIPKVPRIEKQEIRNEAISEVKWFGKDKLSEMSPDEFVSMRTYKLLQDWMSGNKYSLEIYKEIKP